MNEDEGNMERPKLVNYVCVHKKFGRISFVVPERYEITGICGKGAYGIVAKALDKKRNKVVAIKKIIDPFTRDNEHMKRMYRELQLIHHFRDGVCLMGMRDVFSPISYDRFTDIYFLMDYMDLDLSSLLHNKKRMIPEKDARYYIYEILRGLKEIHTADVLHRDIKPGMNFNQDLKICDFGLARGIDLKTDPTMSTTYVATRWYRAPELLLMWNNTNKALDIWSAGCVFAELLDKPTPRRARHLIPGKHYLDQIDKTLNTVGTPPPESIRGCAKAKKYMKALPERKGIDFKKRYPHVSDEAIDLLKKMLEFDPLKRITAEQALAHPFFVLLHDTDDEPSSPKFDFKKVDVGEGANIKRQIYDFVMAWNERENKIGGDAEYDDTEIIVEC